MPTEYSFVDSTSQLKGEGQPLDYTGAVKLIRQAADLGLGTAQTQLGLLDTASLEMLEAQKEGVTQGAFAGYAERRLHEVRQGRPGQNHDRT